MLKGRLQTLLNEYVREYCRSGYPKDIDYSGELKDLAIAFCNRNKVKSSEWSKKAAPHRVNMAIAKIKDKFENSERVKTLKKI